MARARAWLSAASRCRLAPFAPASGGRLACAGGRARVLARRCAAEQTDTYERMADELEDLLGAMRDSKAPVPADDELQPGGFRPDAPQPSGLQQGGSQPGAPQLGGPQPGELPPGVEGSEVYPPAGGGSPGPAAGVGPPDTTLATTASSLYSSVGLRPAPAEYGEDMFIASSAQIEQIVDFRLQKVHASLNALKRYTKELEFELNEREEELDKTFHDLQAEQAKRQSVEDERDMLQQQRQILEAKMVEDLQVQADAEKEVEEMDRKAEEVAEALSRGEISEEEAMRIEEELIRAQAKRLAAQQVQDRNSKDMDGLKVQAEEAVQRAEKASADAERLQQQLEALQAEVQRAQEEKEAETQLKEAAELKFKGLVERLQARVADSTM